MIRNARITALALAALSILGTVIAQSTQSGTVANQQPSANTNAPVVQLPSPVSAGQMTADPSDGHQVYNLGMAWNESVRHASVAVANNSGAAVTVLGVQGTGGIFVTSIPAAIPANSSANFNVLLMSPGISEPSSDFLKVLTTSGIVTVEIQHGRTPVAQFSSQNLNWSVGGSAAAQTVTLTMSPGTATPIGVKVFGKGNSATLAASGSNKYTINVTPGSTAIAESFAAVIIFNPQLPGVSGAISCQVK